VVIRAVHVYFITFNFFSGRNNLNIIIDPSEISMQKIQKDEFPCRVSFYTELHASTVDYPELIKLTKKRLSILKSIETINDHRIMDLSPNEDELSHFLCRLITCSVPWASQWFIAMETKLFRARLATYNLSEIKNFFYTKYLRRAKNLLVNEKSVFIQDNTQFTLDNAPTNTLTDYQTVHVYFSRAPELVRDCKVELKKGYFVLHDANMAAILANEFREYLRGRMDSLKANTNLRNDERFSDLAVDLFSVPQKSTGQLKSILDCAPPCIDRIVKRMKHDRHLKYNDRQILIRYLKDCGLPVNDSIEFLRSNFSCDPARFDREFVYVVRHNYGLEGKRANYSCYTCPQVVAMGACPFTSKCVISDYLSEKGFQDIEDVICGEIENRNYLKGCSILLKHKRRSDDDIAVTSPFVFYSSFQTK
ncbi:Eukaryotic-type DNA primase, large subunit, partial [Trachipleistophora hominis]